jgi:hypothetical protein
MEKGHLVAIIALCPGIADLILSAVHLIRTSDDSIGTGSGKLGAVVAAVLGVVGIVFAIRAMIRPASKRGQEQ